jgi:hypothetical protein
VAGLPTSTKRVAWLMREAGLTASPKTRRRVVQTEATARRLWIRQSGEVRSTLSAGNAVLFTYATALSG